MTDEEWIGAEEAAILLRVSSRMVYRYAEDEDKIRKKAAGRRVLFNHADVLRYAQEINADDKPAPTKEVIGAEEAIQLLRETQQRAEVYARRIGDLEGQLRLLPPPEVTDQIRQELAETHRANDRLVAENERLRAQLKGPWWRRLFGS